MFTVIPAIDVLDGKVVRLARGDYDQVTAYETNPIAVAERFVASGASVVHVVDLAGARDGVPDVRLAQAMGSSGVGFQIGGGLRRAGDVAAVLEAGAQRAVAGTTAVWDAAELASMLELAGPDRLAAAVDVADGRARGAGWLDEGRPFADVLAELAGWGLARIHLTAISRDGMMSGPDLDLLATAVATGLEVVAAGGIGSLDDIRRVAGAGAAGVIIGRALYEGRFTVEEAVAAVG